MATATTTPMMTAVSTPPETGVSGGDGGGRGGGVGGSWRKRYNIRLDCYKYCLQQTQNTNVLNTIQGGGEGEGTLRVHVEIH